MSRMLNARQTGTCASTRMRSISSAVRLRHQAATTALISSACCARSASVLNRGSCSKPGRSMALASCGRPVVERRGVLQAVTLALAYHAEAVVARHRVLHQAEHRFVEGEVHRLAAAGAAGIAVVERDQERQRVADAG